MHRLTGHSGKASIHMSAASKQSIVPEYLPYVEPFFDLSTLAERLRYDDSAMLEYPVKDGNWHLVRFIVQTRGENGEAEQVLFAMRLYSEEKRREKDLMSAADAVRRANEAKSEFLSCMSHDIRTPLTSIVGNTAAILENEDSFSPEQKRRLLEDVNEDAQWLIRMVENLLSITRMSGGQAKIEKDCEAAEEIVGVSVSKFTKRFPAIHVSIEVPDEVLMVPMDATLIRQVIMNLLENAAIHGGNVTQIRVCLSREGTNACFAISDNGVGIPKERLSTIFNGGLSGVSHNNFDMKKNMGIGLSVCYTIVKAHDGTMTAENLDSGGACFRFYLPLEEGINSEIEG